LAWLSVWSEVQTCIWPSWCHCHSLSLASVKSRLVLPFWYRPTRVVLDIGLLNGSVCVCVCEYPVYSLVSLSTDTNRLVWLPRLKLSLALSDLSQCICINLLNNIWFHFVLWYSNVWLQCRRKGYSVLSWQLKPNLRPRFSSEPTVTDHQEKFRTVAMLSLSTTRLLTEGVLLLLYQLPVKGLRHHAW